MKRNKKGFTMIELLVVLLIIGILAAVAAPMYLANTRRAKASEAVAVMSIARQAEREYFTKHNGFLAVAAGDMDNDPEAILPATPGLSINVGTPQYFSNITYSVSLTAVGTDGASNLFVDPPVQDFLISVNGATSVQCGAPGVTDCAIHADDVKTPPANTDFLLEMDNTGRIFVSYNGSASPTWSAY